jgi:hypothetical protein
MKLAVPLAMLSVAFAAGPARAQEARDLVVLGHLETLPASAVAELDAVTVARLAGAGILGGAIGLFGGAYLGAAIAHDEDCAECLEELTGALVVGTIGEGLLLPLGVHLANGRRGSYWTSALVSVGLAAAGAGLMEAAHWDPPTVPIVAVAVPVAQVATSIAIERATAD